MGCMNVVERIRQATLLERSTTFLQNVLSVLVVYDNNTDGSVVSSNQQAANTMYLCVSSF